MYYSSGRDTYLCESCIALILTTQHLSYNNFTRNVSRYSAALAGHKRYNLYLNQQ
jgi:hypothetical protein